MTNSEKKKNWFSRNLKEIRNTLLPLTPQDTRAQRFAKRIGWIMFLIMMGCCTIAMIVALSFAH